MNAQRLAEVRYSLAGLRRALAEDDWRPGVWFCRSCGERFEDSLAARGHERREPGHVVDFGSKSKG